MIDMGSVSSKFGVGLLGWNCSCGGGGERNCFEGERKNFSLNM